MKPFSERWRQCLHAARQASDARSHSTPAEAADWVPGLLRRYRQAHSGEEAAVELWSWYALRGLAVASALMLLCLAFASRGPHPSTSFRPTVENAVAGVLWTL